MPLPLLDIGGSALDLCHPTYQTLATQRAFYRTCDRLFDDTNLAYAFAKDGSGGDMLPKHARENKTRWDARRSLCCPTAYTRQIADHYVSHVTRTAPQRGTVAGGAIPDAWQTILNDADGLGTPLSELLRQGARLAFLEQDAYLLLDLVAATDTPISKADQAGNRTIVRVIPADDVLTSQRSIGGRLLSAIIRLPGSDGPPILWRIDGTTGQRARLDSKGKITSVDPPAPHGLLRCPLIPIGPMPALIPPVCEAQKAIARTDSLRRYRQGEDAIPWIVVTGTANANQFVSELEKNPAFSAFEDKDARALNIGSAVEVADSLRKDIIDDEERLYRTAKVRPVTAQSGNPESGVAHAFRFVDADVELATAATALERAENELAAIWAQANNLSDPPKAQYPRTFVPVDRVAELASVSQVSASTLPEPLKFREYQRAANVLYPNDETIAQELEDGRAIDPGTNDGQNNGTVSGTEVPT
jgi:hypothetical protein